MEVAMKLLATVLLLLVTTLPAFSQAPSVVADNVGNNEAMYYFHQRKVARATDGTLMVVWIDIKSNTPGGQVQYSIYDDAFQVWSPPAALSNAGDRARQPAITADDAGNFHATWMQRNTSAEDYQAFYSKYSGGGFPTWSSPVQVSVAPSARAWEGTIEVGTDGTIWVVYNNDGEGAGVEFVYAVKSTDGGATWSTTADTLSSGGNIGSSSTNARVTLAAGPNGRMAAIWHDGQPWNTDRREIFVNLFDGSSWGSMEMISDTTSADRAANWYPTVAIDANSVIYTIYHTNNASGDTTRQLLLQKKAWTDPWSASTTSVIDYEYAGDLLSTSATIDENGFLHLVNRRDRDDGTGLDNVVYRISPDGGATWSTPTVLNRPANDAGYVSIASRIRPAYGIDIAWRESRDPAVQDQDTLAVMSTTIPYGSVSVDDKPNPESFSLFENYPNPFNPSTTLRFQVAEQGHVTLTIYDALGRVVRHLVNEVRLAGRYTEQWNATDSNNERVASGLYFSRLTTATGVQTIKMVLIK
jgi:hypothetical protein